MVMQRVSSLCGIRTEIGDWTVVSAPPRDRLGRSLFDPRSPCARSQERRAPGGARSEIYTAI